MDATRARSITNQNLSRRRMSRKTREILIHIERVATQGRSKLNVYTSDLPDLTRTELHYLGYRVHIRRDRVRAVIRW